MMNVDRVKVLRARVWLCCQPYILYYVHIPVYDYDGVLVVILGMFFICVINCLFIGMNMY